MVSVTGAVTARIAKFQAAVQRNAYSHYRRDLAETLSFAQAVERYPDRNALYAYMHHYLWHLAPDEIRDHRRYYGASRRGFGEDAFHAMWWWLLHEHRPERALEIGVYRGQVTSLMGLTAKLCAYNCEVHGISPFSPAADAVSSYLPKVDYLKDTLESNARFGLRPPVFLKALSTDPVALSHIRSTRWNVIYIDGNHDYEVALSDYNVCRDALATGGLLVMDDSSLYTDYRPAKFSFAGHPGPSRVAEERARMELRFVGGVGHKNVFMNA